MTQHDDKQYAVGPVTDALIMGILWAFIVTLAVIGMSAVSVIVCVGLSALGVI